MELAVDLGTGPGQSFTIGRGKGGIRGEFRPPQGSPKLPTALSERPTWLMWLSRDQGLKNPKVKALKKEKYTVGTKGNGEERGKQNKGLCQLHFLLNSPFLQ